MRAEIEVRIKLYEYDDKTMDEKKSIRQAGYVGSGNANFLESELIKNVIPVGHAMISRMVAEFSRSAIDEQTAATKTARSHQQ